MRNENLEKKVFVRNDYDFVFPPQFYYNSNMRYILLLLAIITLVNADTCTHSFSLTFLKQPPIDSYWKLQDLKGNIYLTGSYNDINTNQDIQDLCSGSYRFIIHDTIDYGQRDYYDINVDGNQVLGDESFSSRSEAVHSFTIDNDQQISDNDNDNAENTQIENRKSDECGYSISIVAILEDSLHNTFWKLYSRKNVLLASGYSISSNLNQTVRALCKGSYRLYVHDTVGDGFPGEIFIFEDDTPVLASSGFNGHRHKYDFNVGSCVHHTSVLFNYHDIPANISWELYYEGIYPIASRSFKTHETLSWSQDGTCEGSYELIVKDSSGQGYLGSFFATVDGRQVLHENKYQSPQELYTYQISSSNVTLWKSATLASIVVSSLVGCGYVMCSKLNREIYEEIDERNEPSIVIIGEPDLPLCLTPKSQAGEYDIGEAEFQLSEIPPVYDDDLLPPESFEVLLPEFNDQNNHNQASDDNDE